MNVRENAIVFLFVCLLLFVFFVVFCRYDSSKGQWENSDPMQTLRSRVGVAVVKKKLYVFGGYDGSSRLNTVECYHPQVHYY